MDATSPPTAFRAVCRVLYILSIACILSFQFHSLVQAHGCMRTPNQRGTLTGKGLCASTVIDTRAPIDYFAHFPAGPITRRLGGGMKYQKQQAGRFGWVEYKPLNKRFRWRSGVCGDIIGRTEAHRKGGEFFYGGKIVATYEQGSTIQISLKIEAHHNGFMELHICDATKCGGDINTACFRKGHCQQLKRAYHPSCDGGYHKFCGPIDRNYPGRWYFPCSVHPPNTRRDDYYGVGGNGFIHYKLPRNFYTSHAVLQWFWTSANTCNPPGVKQYFEGRDRPRNWRRCRGQASAVGGYVRNAKLCGGRNRFPEEYLQCADIRVVKRGRRMRSYTRSTFNSSNEISGMGHQLRRDRNHQNRVSSF